MDPFTLLTVGPSILRGIGSLFGGKTQEVADTVANVADAVTGQSPEVQRQRMQEALDAMPPEARVELAKIANEAESIKADMESRRLQHEEHRLEQVQETARTEAKSEDEYVRRTRPWMARWSFTASFVYVAAGEVARALGADTGADPYILGVLLSPAVTYITGRTVDAFSPHKGPRMGENVIPFKKAA